MLKLARLLILKNARLRLFEMQWIKNVICSSHYYGENIWKMKMEVMQCNNACFLRFLHITYNEYHLAKYKALPNKNSFIVRDPNDNNLHNGCFDKSLIIVYNLPFISDIFISLPQKWFWFFVSWRCHHWRGLNVAYGLVL